MNTTSNKRSKRVILVISIVICAVIVALILIKDKQYKVEYNKQLSDTGKEVTINTHIEKGGVIIKKYNTITISVDSLESFETKMKAETDAWIENHKKISE